MPDLSIVKTRIHAGIWEGIVTTESADAGEPAIDVTHLDRKLQGFALTRDKGKGRWNLKIAIPAELLSDGVQVFVISDRETGEKLDSFTILTGEPLQDDIRAEMELLRAELDMLKGAFRRHCLETL